MKSREMSGWMSVSDQAGSPLAPYKKKNQVYRVNWLRAKAQMDRWQEELKLVENEMTWMGLWFDYHRKIWDRRGNESKQQGLKGHACYAWKQVWMWEMMAREAREFFSKVIQGGSQP